MIIYIYNGGMCVHMKNLFDLYVRSYALTKENAPEFFDIVSDIYETAEFQSMADFIQHANITRVQHIMSVAYMSYSIAKEKGLDYVRATRGAMLHDLFYYDWHVPGDGSHRLHGYRHPGFALKNARALFTLSEMEENIIKRHMWPLTPTPPKYKESWIVCLSDKYCAHQESMTKFSSKIRQKIQSEKEAQKNEYNN